MSICKQPATTPIIYCTKLGINYEKCKFLSVSQAKRSKRFGFGAFGTTSATILVQIFYDAKIGKVFEKRN